MKKYVHSPGNPKLWNIHEAIKKGVDLPWLCAACNKPVQLRRHGKTPVLMHYQKSSCSGVFEKAELVFQTRKLAAMLSQSWGINPQVDGVDGKLRTGSRLQFYKTKGMTPPGLTSPAVLCQTHMGPILAGLLGSSRDYEVLKEFEKTYGVPVLMLAWRELDWLSSEAKVRPDTPSEAIWLSRPPASKVDFSATYFDKVSSLSTLEFESTTRVSGLSFSPLIADKSAHYVHELIAIARAKKWSTQVKAIIFDKQSNDIWRGWFQANACALQVPLVWLRYFFVEKMTQEKGQIFNFSELCRELAALYANELSEPEAATALALEFEHDTKVVVDFLLNSQHTKGLFTLVEEGVYRCNKALKL